MFDDLTSKLAAMAQLARSEWAPEVDPDAGPARRAAQVGTVISVVVIGIVALIGILIYSSVSESLPTLNNDQLNASQTSVTDGFANAMELIPIVLLVLVAALVIGVVQRMRMSG